MKEICKIITLLLCTVLLATLLVGCVDEDPQQGEQRGNSTGNTVLGASHVLGNSYIYSAVFSEESLNTYLGRTNIDEAEYEQLSELDNCSLRMMSFNNDKLYYSKISYATYPNFIYYVNEFDIESKNERILYSSYDAIEYLSVVENEIYFVINNSLYKLDLQSGGCINIYAHQTNTRSWNIFSDCAWFISEDYQNDKWKICRIDYDSKELNSVLTKDNPIIRCVLDGDYLYFDWLSENGYDELRCYDIKENRETSICMLEQTHSAAIWSIFNGRLYLNEERRSFEKRNPEQSMGEIEPIFVYKRGDRLLAVLDERIVILDKAGNIYVFDSSSQTMHELFYSQLYGLSVYDRFSYIDVLDCCGEVISNSVEIDGNGITLRVPQGVKSVGFPGVDVTELILPESVEVIEYMSFCEMKNLRAVTFGKGLTTIEEGAFSDCSLLIEITLPEGVESIGAFAFAGCTELKYVYIPSTVSFIGENVFSGCSQELVIYCEKGSLAEQYASDNGLSYIYAA